MLMACHGSLFPCAGFTAFHPTTNGSRNELTTSHLKLGAIIQPVARPRAWAFARHRAWPPSDKIICRNEGLHQQPEMLFKQMPLDPDSMRNGAMHDIHNRRWRNEAACETTAARHAVLCSECFLKSRVSATGWTRAERGSKETAFIRRLYCLRTYQDKVRNIGHIVQVRAKVYLMSSRWLDAFGSMSLGLPDAPACPETDEHKVQRKFLSKYTSMETTRWLAHSAARRKPLIHTRQVRGTSGGRHRRC